MTWPGNSTQAVTWSVANTAAAPVSCANVAISLSPDGGLTYPTVLAASTPNDGSETILVPNISTTTARVRVACATNVFFDISNVNFAIAPVACFWADVNCSCGVSSTTIDVDDLVFVANAWNLYQSGGGLIVAADVDCRSLPASCGEVPQRLFGLPPYLIDPSKDQFDQALASASAIFDFVLSLLPTQMHPQPLIAAGY